MQNSVCVNRVFKDENTGREIRQLTDFPDGAYANYFRYSRYLPDGRTLAWYGQKAYGRRVMLMDIASGRLQLRPDIPSQLKLRERDGKLWFLHGANLEDRSHQSRGKGSAIFVWEVDLPDGKPKILCELPKDLPGRVVDISCDGEQLVVVDNRQDLAPFPPTLHFKSAEDLSLYLHRPRSATMSVYTIRSGICREIQRIDNACFGHVDTSPVDPGLIRFSADVIETHAQRIWTIRTDGSERHPIRVQSFGEMVTHEFWWSDPSLIGYTYQDRRGDPTLEYQHCSEYTTVPTRLGISDLAGNEIYLSDPLNSYHTHILCSKDGSLLCGEGTDGNSFVFAAPFDIKNSNIPLEALATIHTEYIPFRGQYVESAFSADGEWLMYADKLPGSTGHQLFGVRV